MFMPSVNMQNRLFIKLFVLFLFITVVFLSSCSVEKNRKVLRFFFDGVPTQDSVKVEKKDNVSSSVKPSEKKENDNIVRKVSEHPDHKSRKCEKCHSRSSTNFLVTDKKKLCFICHKKEKFDGAFVHGPVAVQACTACHSPHKSKNRKLLLAEGKDLCLLCHKIPLAGSAFPCKGDVCLECHEPHVATNKYFLKEDIKRTNNVKNTSPHSN